MTLAPGSVGRADGELDVCPRSAAGVSQHEVALRVHTASVNAGIQPVPMLGHVTSSYHRAALGRSFALALVKNGRNLIGHTLTAGVGDQLVDVVVADTVLYDPEGNRRDG